MNTNESPIKQHVFDTYKGSFPMATRIAFETSSVTFVLTGIASAALYLVRKLFALVFRVASVNEP